MSLQDKINNAKETPWMRYYRPKEQIAYMYGNVHTATIVCHPRSKWLCTNEQFGAISLKNKNVTISLTATEFKEQWVEWKEKE